jgi:hypothetical protein
MTARKGRAFIVLVVRHSGNSRYLTRNQSNVPQFLSRTRVYISSQSRDLHLLSCAFHINRKHGRLSPPPPPTVLAAVLKHKVLRDVLVTSIDLYSVMYQLSFDTFIVAYRSVKAYSFLEFPLFELAVNTSRYPSDLHVDITYLRQC